jgi:hypothetical protein
VPAVAASENFSELAVIPSLQRCALLRIGERFGVEVSGVHSIEGSFGTLVDEIEQMPLVSRSRRAPLPSAAEKLRLLHIRSQHGSN